ncbi:hypothetical protein S83_015781, partial [Arachis hypogaea]
EWRVYCYGQKEKVVGRVQIEKGVRNGGRVNVVPLVRRCLFLAPLLTRFLFLPTQSLFFLFLAVVLNLFFDAVERHRVVFIVGTSIASVATAWIGYSLCHFHDEKVEQRLESIEKVMKHKHNLEHSKIKDIVGPGDLSVSTCAATAATTLIIGIVPFF